MSTTTSNRTILSQLNIAQTAITNAKANPTIANSILPYGYTAESMAKGQNLLTIALESFRKQQNELSEVSNANSIVKTARRNLHKIYSPHLKLARIALEAEPGMLTILQLNGPRSEELESWLEQVEAFYTHSQARADIRQLLAMRGISQEQIEQGSAKAAELRQALTQRQNQRGISKEATSACAQDRRKLRIWMATFIKVTRVALSEQPQLLKSLGVE